MTRPTLQLPEVSRGAPELSASKGATRAAALPWLPPCPDLLPHYRDGVALQGDCHGSDPARSCSSTSPAAVPSLVPLTGGRLRRPVKLRIAPPASCLVRHHEGDAGEPLALLEGVDPSAKAQPTSCAR